MPNDFTLLLEMDTSIAEQLLDAYEHAIASGELTVSEASDTLASFIVFHVIEDPT